MRHAVQRVVLNKTRGLTRWRAARDAGNAKVIFLGDSTFAGFNSDGANYTNNRAHSTPTHAKDQLLAKGVDARCDWLCCDGNSANAGGATGITNLAAAEPRLVLGTSTVVDTLQGLGGFYFLNSTTTATPVLEWTTTVPCDRVGIQCLKGSGPRSLEVFCDDVSMGVIDLANASTAYYEAIVSLPTAQASGVARKIGIKRVAGGVRISGVRPYLAAGKQIIIGNAGRGSVTAVTLGTAGTSGTVPVSLPDTITNAAPDLTVINLGLNDQTANATPAAYKTAIQTLTTAAKVTGDVILCAPHPINLTAEAAATYNSAYYRAVLAELVNENGLPPLVNLYDLFGGYAAANARSLYADGVHMLSAGSYEEATAIVAAMLR